MKFRIVKNQQGQYAVQYKIWFWSFWTFHGSWTGEVITFRSREEAEARIEILKRRSEPDVWKEVK